MSAIAVIRQIANGFIVTNVKDGTQFYVENFDINVLVNKDVAHEAALRILVNSFSSENGKIPAIKAVRNYCNDNGFNKYIGLRDAKEYVESIRVDFKPHYFQEDCKP